MKYRKRPIVIDAKQYIAGDGNYDAEILAWIGDGDDAWIETGNGVTSVLKIKTLEGVMTADPGDWIIKGVKGEFYPCKPDIFEASYEAIQPERAFPDEFYVAGHR